MHYSFKSSALFSLLFVMPVLMTQAKAAFLKLDIPAYYAALAGNSLEKVNSMLSQLNESSIPAKTAYEGTLLMKKAGLVKKISERLSLFKAGRKKLEDAIKKDEGNAEYHFLRLIIQENSPKLAKYKSDLKKDQDIVRTMFKKLSPAVQLIVKDYSKKSTFLKPEDF